MEKFTVKETALLLEITERAVQKRCKVFKVRKIDNKYSIDLNTFRTWREEILKANELLNERSGVGSHNEVEIESLKAEIEALKLENLQLKKPMDLKAAIDIVTIEAARQGVTHRIYSNEEFEELLGTIALSENQEEQIKYLRDRIDKQDRALISIAKQVEQRNFIEAMDKGYNTPK